MEKQARYREQQCIDTVRANEALKSELGVALATKAQLNAQVQHQRSEGSEQALKEMAQKLAGEMAAKIADTMPMRERSVARLEEAEDTTRRMRTELKEREEAMKMMWDECARLRVQSRRRGASCRTSPICSGRPLAPWARLGGPELPSAMAALPNVAV